MIVEGETLYVAQYPDEDHTFNTKSEAIENLQERGGSIEPENGDVSIVEVDFSEEDWSVMEIPWQEIALSLLQD